MKKFEKISTAALYIGLSALIGSTGQVVGGIFGDKYGEKAVLSFTAVSSDASFTTLPSIQ